MEFKIDFKNIWHHFTFCLYSHIFYQFKNFHEVTNSESVTDWIDKKNPLSLWLMKIQSPENREEQQMSG